MNPPLKVTASQEKKNDFCHSLKSPANSFLCWDFFLTVVCVFFRFVHGYVGDDDLVTGTPLVAGVQLQLQGVQTAQVLQQEHRLVRVGLVVSQLTRLCVVDLQEKNSSFIDESTSQLLHALPMLHSNWFVCPSLVKLNERNAHRRLLHVRADVLLLPKVDENQNAIWHTMNERRSMAKVLSLARTHICMYGRMIHTFLIHIHTNIIIVVVPPTLKLLVYSYIT